MLAAVLETRIADSFVRIGSTTTGALAAAGRFSQGTAWERRHTGHR
jgi:hypothetical protein